VRDKERILKTCEGRILGYVRDMERILRIWKGNSGHVRDKERILRTCEGYGKDTEDT
jgi:hypothetical protein